jgi:RNA polymerase subunit RPABC4/transcription elongation factor Spt4
MFYECPNCGCYIEIFSEYCPECGEYALDDELSDEELENDEAK